MALRRMEISVASDLKIRETIRAVIEVSHDPTIQRDHDVQKPPDSSDSGSTVEEMLPFLPWPSKSD